jgi:hypothetical protein
MKTGNIKARGQGRQPSGAACPSRHTAACLQPVACIPDGPPAGAEALPATARAACLPVAVPCMRAACWCRGAS